MNIMLFVIVVLAIALPTVRAAEDTVVRPGFGVVFHHLGLVDASQSHWRHTFALS